MLGFLTAAVAILAAGLVAVVVIVLVWLLRHLAPDNQTRKSKRRRFARDQRGKQARIEHTSRFGTGSPFQVLGFSQSPNSFSEVRAAFLRESNNTHPDTNPNDEQAAHRFDQVKKAYEQVGNVERFEKYLRLHPPEKIIVTVNGGSIPIISFEEFTRKFESLRSQWLQTEAQQTIELDNRLLTANRHVRRTFDLSRVFGQRNRSGPPIVIEDVIFSELGEQPKIEYLRIFDCLLRIDSKETFYAALRLLLAKNGFKDTFSEVRGNSTSVTFIGDLPGTFIFPKPIKVLISHDDQPERLFTRLWDLGLYRGPKVVHRA